MALRQSASNSEKQIPHPAQTAGIPFDFAQGRRDDKVVRNGAV
jgi:hypothetical protein